MNGYNLSRNFVDFSFENPSKIKPNHYALYFFAIEHCNRLGWKLEFGLPTTMAMEAIGIRSYNTYIKTFNELIDFGFFIIVERSKNQFSANIIKLSNYDKALDKALDKAFVKHATKHEPKQSESTQQSIDSIDKPINNKPITTECEIDAYESFKLQIKNEGQTAWIESFYRLYDFKQNSLSKVMDDFILHLHNTPQDKPKDYKEFKKHFTNWCRVVDSHGKLNDYKKNKPKEKGSL